MSFAVNFDIARSTLTEAIEFLKSPWNQVLKRSGVIAQSNGVTTFGLVRAGTIMGRITATQEYRPCNKSIANGAGVATTTVVVQDTRVWRVGDAFFVNGVDSTQVVDSITNATDFELDGVDTWADLDVLSAGDGSQVAVGINLRDSSTIDGHDENFANIENQTETLLVLSGEVRESSLIGDTAAVAADLAQVIYN